MPEDTFISMKVLFLLFSLIFSIATINDCCLRELPEEFTSLACNNPLDEKHGENVDEKESPHCLCSTFCSYSLLLGEVIISLQLPSCKIHVFQISSALGREIFHPYLIFHPPIV